MKREEGSVLKPLSLGLRQFRMLVEKNPEEGS
jgi:hypothetical protein